ncbi:hypothetical protein EYZ11_002820 [Aspergillus tanneri]|uniref:Uncharacterized protein n=1 Tax=Aspergillus tanneri TaxID=1220188 RepID=A0A4V3UQ51_9EURO|nr:hypothetical protein EYZ11_002820 [Aspergillus tanneri]
MTVVAAWKIRVLVYNILHLTHLLMVRVAAQVWAIMLLNFWGVIGV